MRVDIEKIRDIIAKYDEMMDLDPNNIDLYENGVKLEIPQKYIDDWKFVGLGFAWFIKTEFYKTGWVEDWEL